MTQARKKSRTKSNRAGLLFPVGKLKRHMRKGVDGVGRVADEAAVYNAAIQEYLFVRLARSADAYTLTRSKPNVPGGSVYTIKGMHVHAAVDDDTVIRRLMRRTKVPRALGTDGKQLAKKPTKAKKAHTHA